MILLLEATLKGSLILLVALGMLPLLRRRSAALRHYVLAAAVALATTAPIVQLAIPSWRLPIDWSGVALDEAWQREATATQPSADVMGRDRQAESRGPAMRVAAPVNRVSIAAALFSVWIAGAAFGLAVLVVGLGRLARLTSGRVPIVEGVWVNRAADICRDYGIRRPVRLLQGSDPTLLVTWGLRQPKIILPRVVHDWPEERVRLVLLHELAHIRRGDWIVQLATELLRAACWFNPLVWIACRRLRHESEEACDDAVLNRGVEGSDYATHLVEIARDLQPRPNWLPAPAIARTSSLERRVKAMLDAHRNRRPLSRSACAAALLALVAVTIPIAGLAAQRAFATVAGSIVDPMNGVLPGVTIVLTNAQSKAKYEVQSDRIGRYEFAGVPSGDYLFEAKLPGFARLQGTLTLSGQNVQQDLRLEVGSIEETVHVQASSGIVAMRADVESGFQRLQSRPRRELPTCGSAPGGSGPAIGGNIRAPRKLTHLAPRYPAGGPAGTVVLEGRIGTDGNIEELNVLSSSDDGLSSAALEAVRQWQFDETLLNCVPVAIKIKVTVNFHQ